MSLAVVIGAALSQPMVIEPHRCLVQGPLTQHLKFENQVRALIRSRAMSF
jgi:hypothetical protein